MTIALLCPTRGRPDQCKRMIDSVINTTNRNITIYLAISVDDKYLYNIEDKIDRVSVKTIEMLDYPTGYKWNRLAELAYEDKHSYFMLAADDMIFTTPCWDDALIKKTPHVYHLQDSRDIEGTPHPIVNRAYLEAMGYFVPPIFLHWYLDTWTVKIAKANHCFTYLKDFMLEHRKPSDHGIYDETHSRLRNKGWNEVDQYTSEKLSNTFLGMECQRLGWALSKENVA